MRMASETKRRANRRSSEESAGVALPLKPAAERDSESRVPLFLQAVAPLRGLPAGLESAMLREDGGSTEEDEAVPEENQAAAEAGESLTEEDGPDEDGGESAASSDVPSFLLSLGAGDPSVIMLQDDARTLPSAMSGPLPTPGPEIETDAVITTPPAGEIPLDVEAEVGTPDLDEAEVEAAGEEVRDQLPGGETEDEVSPVEATGLDTGAEPPPEAPAGPEPDTDLSLAGTGEEEAIPETPVTEEGVVSGEEAGRPGTQPPVLAPPVPIRGVVSETAEETAPSALGAAPGGPATEAAEVAGGPGAGQMVLTATEGAEAEAAPAGEGGAEGGAGEEAIVEAWQAGVQGAAGELPEPSLEGAAGAPAGLRASGQQAAAAQNEAQAQIPGEASGNIPAVPEVEQPPPPPAANPIPAHTARIQEASGQRLPPQEPPRLVATPRRRVRQGLFVGGTTPRLDQQPVDERLFQLIITPGALELAAIPEAAQNRERRALQDALTALSGPLPDEPREGTGQPAPLVDRGPQPAPPLPEGLQTPVGQVVARLLAQPGEATRDVMRRLRRIAYPNGVLLRQYDDIGQSLESSLRPELETELREIAEAADISGGQLDEMVDRRRQELESETCQCEEAIETATTEACTGVSESGQQTLNIIAGTRQATDEEIVRRQEAAGGGSDPQVINARRDLVVAWVRNHVTTQITDYQNAGERRDQELNRGQTQQENAYNATAQREVYQILNPPSAAEDDAETSPPEPAALQDLAAEVRAWTRERIQSVQGNFRSLKQFAAGVVRRYRSTIETAGTQAIEAARQWAEERVLEGQGWWALMMARFQRWFSQAREGNERWEVRRTQQTRDGIADDLDYIMELHAQVQEGATREQLLQQENLTAEQQAIIREYFDQPAGVHPLDVAAARLRERLAANHRTAAVPVFEQELLAKPDEDFDKLNAVGRAMRPGFDAAQIAQDVHAAMDQMGTDEAAIYQSLQNLNAIQAAAVRKTYRVRYGRDLDRDLREELSGEELDRAQLQLEGRQARADAVALHDAMGLINTDEQAIMDLLRGRSPEEIEVIRAEYRARFGDALENALSDNLDEGNEQDQASALLRGDRETADAIALDDAMRGGLFGWGTSEEDVEATYNRVRSETLAQAEREGWNAEQMEAEIRRRTRAIEQRFNQRYADVEQYQVPGMTGQSVLRQAFASEMNPGPERDLANALADNNMLAADAARIEIERRGVYASDEAINRVLRSQYERSLQATRLDQGPARRMAIEREIERIVSANPHITEDELSHQRFLLEHQMERDLETEAQQRSRVGMEALQHAYSTEYGLPLGFVIAMNMSGNDEARARAMLQQGGRLTALQEIEYATRGAGTDEEAIRGRLSGMTRAEIQQLREQWERRHPGESFNAMLRGELSGRDESDIMDMVIHGAPESASERIERERRRMNRELEDLTGVLGGAAAGREEAWLRRQMTELNDLEPRLHRTDLSPEERTALRDELDMRVQRVEEAVKDHRRAIDSVTNTATQIVGLVVGITVGALLTAVSGGALGPVMIAVLASVASTLATMGTKQLIQGGSYGVEDIGVDLAVGVVDALTAAATAGMGGRILRGAGGAAQRTVRPTQATRLAGRLSQSALGQRIGRLPGVQSLRSGLSRLNQMETGFLTRGITGENPLARLARSNSRNMQIMAELLADGIENTVSAAPSAFVQTALSDETWQGNPALNLLQGTAMGVGTSVAMGGVMQGAGHLYHGARERIRLSTPEGRLAEANRILGQSFQGFRERHPDASYFDFLSHSDGIRAQVEVQQRGLLPGAAPEGAPRIEAEPAVRPGEPEAMPRGEAEPAARPTEPEAAPRGEAEPTPRPGEPEAGPPPEAEPARRPGEPEDAQRAEAEPAARPGEPEAMPPGEAEPATRPTEPEAAPRGEAEPTPRPGEPEAGPPPEAEPARRPGEPEDARRAEAEPAARPTEPEAAPRTADEPTTRPDEPEGAAPAAVEAQTRAEALRSGLPEGMRDRVQLDIDPELTGRTVRVTPDIRDGAVVGVRIHAGPDARPIDIMMHAPVVQGMQRYAGLIGRVRTLLERLHAWFYLETPVEVGSRAWEARLELEKLPAIIEERMRGLSRSDLDADAQARLLSDIEGLGRQIDDHQRILESPELRQAPGRGFVAAEEIEPVHIRRRPRDFDSLTPREQSAVREWEGHLEHVRREIAEQRAEIERLRRDLDAYERRREDDLAQARHQGITAADISRHREQTARGRQARSRKIEDAEKWLGGLQRFRNEFQGNIDQIYGTATWSQMGYKDLGGSVDPCFKPGTVVKTPAGDTPIEALRTGDMVYAYDSGSGSIIESLVLGVHKNWTRFFVDVEIDGETISATRMHRFWVQNEETWIPAKALQTGTQLFSCFVREAKITSIQVYSVISETFNLEISGVHNYFVGDSGVLVHNGSGSQDPDQRESNFADPTRRKNTIYIVRDRQGRVVYVGKTYQGEGDPATRFAQHLRKKPHWQERGYYVAEIITSPPDGWTDFETAVWERHTILKNGGPNQLENIADPISQDKFNEYRKAQYGHNPCV